eukprot:CAMPEP_0170189156 /NCGR_PEP_ID=MMETSP0040_2-20121228/46097_1 /TAXON_ID=641309 /ORGANISM="Lotharella oceanica, Strain CCMP622" /LENGTH=227 /DNA_ID=CAMNT_0010436639 /DNA_START=203 /DNA_END=886 /DNA_ORIENTATION=-
MAGMVRESVGIDDEYPANGDNALISGKDGRDGKVRKSSMGSLGSQGTPKQNYFQSKPKSGSHGSSLNTIRNNDLNENHEEEIKKIMAALDRGGTKEEIAQLESRLSKMSRAISMDVDNKKMQRVVGGMTLAPIQENHKIPAARKSGGAHAKTVHSSDISSDEESVEESSSSDSDDHLSSPPYSQRGFPPNDAKDSRRYSQTLKNEGAIDKLQSLTQALPKLKPYYVA